MQKKQRARVAWVSVLAVSALAGCRQRVTRNQPASERPEPVPTAQIDLATSGTVGGTIRFAGKAPAPIVIDMAQDPACNAAMKTPNMTEQYAVRNGRMANVLVYVKDGLGNRVYAAPKTPVVLDQKGCRFAPHVIAAMAGQPVEFLNSDPTMHNVHIVPPDSDAAGWLDISQPAMSGEQQHIFHSFGLMIPVRCNNHPWMEAFLNVLWNPFFAVSNAEGHFEIAGLPPGNYTLVAVQEKLGEQTATVRVESGKKTAANFTFTK